MKKKFASLLLALLMVVSFIPSATLAASAETQTGFSDVAATAWYAGNVSYVYENGLMNGISATAFEPQTSLTRAMFVTILGRMDGVDESAYPGSSFTDVLEGKWYSSYVAWAAENGIVNGYSADTFGTNDPVTREQMATIIARYVDYAKITLPEADNVTEGFTDAASVSNYAALSLELMRTSGIITGYSDGTFLPKNTATRAEAATIFMRLDQAIRSIATEEPAETSEPNEIPEPNPSEAPTESPAPSEPIPPSESPAPSTSPEPSKAIVASGICGDNPIWTWTMDEAGTLTISGTGDMPEIDSYNPPWDANSINEVVFEAGITGIADWVFYYCENLTSVNIPDGVTNIGMYSFADTALASITIPDGVTAISNGAFSSTALTSVVVPNSVTLIGSDAFWGCTSLTTVSLPDSITKIGDYVFMKCSALTSITIPDSVTSIGVGAFSGCTSLTSITIPAEVTLIGGGAFDGCENLTDVYYSGTEAQWNAIEMKVNNDRLTSATIHYERCASCN